MKQRTLGILGGALLVGGVVLSIASGIAASRLAPDRDAIDRPAAGAIPRHLGPGQPGPVLGDPRHPGFPRPGQQAPAPHPSPSG